MISPRSEGRIQIYLDNASTVWPKPKSVVEGMANWYLECGVNPGRGGYDLAVKAEEMVWRCREALCDFFGGSKPERVVFTANATDALNTVFKGVLKAGDHVITSTLEHNSVLRPLWHHQHESGVGVTYVQFDSDGRISPDDVAKAVRRETKMVALNHASNVLGTVQPVEAVGRMCRERGLFFVVDAAQSAGLVDIDCRRIGIDALCFSGHKALLGPTGIGGICLSETADIAITKWGGTGVRSAERSHLEEYPYRLEAGTPNTVGIAGLALGLQAIKRDGGAETIRAGELRLMEALMDGLRKIEGVRLYNQNDVDDRVPTAIFNLRGVSPDDLAVILDVEHNVLCRPGLHCAPLVHEQLGTAESGGALRFSVGPGNDTDHIATAIAAVAEISAGLRKSNKRRAGAIA